MSIDCREMLMI